VKLLVFAASHRKASVNRKLAKLAADLAARQGAKIDFCEYASLDMPLYDDETYHDQPMPEAAKLFVSKLAAVNGIIIASPEYNWSFPGSLKNIIDWASTATPNPLFGKTVLLLSASPSLRGGAQGLIHLKVPLQALGAFVFPRLFTLSRALEMFDGHALKDAKLNDELVALVSDFIKMASALKPA